MRFIKYILALLGFYFSGFWMALLGFVVGGFISWKLSGGLAGYIARVNGLGNTRAQRATRQALFLKTVFTLMGKLAKADGHISEHEIAHIEKFFQQLGLTTEHRKEAITLFKLGASPHYEIDPLLEEFNQECGQSQALKRMLMVYLIGAAIADGNLHEAETDLLRQIAKSVGYNENQFQQLLAMTRGQDHFSGGQMNPATSRQALKAAYQALGVNKKDSDAIIKKSYRRLIREFHPDKLMGQGLPEDMVKKATERSQEIQTAYDLIKKSRKS
ncbi:MAG: co-chaperone DjlA [Cocleimonas sp.]|nr:co-chaperone DjlA [Cocleimonas sp.]